MMPWKVCLGKTLEQQSFFTNFFFSQDLAIACKDDAQSSHGAPPAASAGPAKAGGGGGKYAG